MGILINKSSHQLDYFLLVHGLLIHSIQQFMVSLLDGSIFIYKTGIFIGSILAVYKTYKIRYLLAASDTVVKSHGFNWGISDSGDYLRQAASRFRNNNISFLFS
ncbi:hypothetical protein SAMN06265218_12029 [Fodinibius sediminis]|uniref:Uncharacterized protein n=1 Tax=Fodinibius sediminis TaxID=1214077 RepID=A0A521EXU8_9BACT|nr:hypothetical protein SAMN06265218_12029 [Fodinibius sediminis]